MPNPIGSNLFSIHKNKIKKDMMASHGQKNTLQDEIDSYIKECKKFNIQVDNDKLLEINDLFNQSKELRGKIIEIFTKSDILEKKSSKKIKEFKNLYSDLISKERVKMLLADAERYINSNNYENAHQSLDNAYFFAKTEADKKDISAKISNLNNLIKNGEVDNYLKTLHLYVDTCENRLLEHLYKASKSLDLNRLTDTQMGYMSKTIMSFSAEPRGYLIKFLISNKTFNFKLKKYLNL